MASDSTLKRVREARRSISEQCDHDPKRLVDYYIELQKQDADRLLKTDKPTPKGKKS